MATRVEVEGLSAEDLCELLSQRYQEELGEGTLESIRTNRVNGRSLLELTGTELGPLLGDRKVVKRFIDSYVAPPADLQPQVRPEYLYTYTVQSVDRCEILCRSNMIMVHWKQCAWPHLVY